METGLQGRVKLERDTIESRTQTEDFGSHQNATLQIQEFYLMNLMSLVILVLGRKQKSTFQKSPHTLFTLFFWGGNIQQYNM